MTKGPKSCFFFCYILPVIIVGSILAPITIIGFMIFLFMMFIGREEFSKGLERCSNGIFSVDWNFTDYSYTTGDGKIESGIENLDEFLFLIQPLINLLICGLWKGAVFLSVLLLKILFSIASLFYNLITKS